MTAATGECNRTELRRTFAQVAATVMFALYIAGVIATLVLRAQAHAAVFQAMVIPFTAFAVVGWLIAMRRARTPLGWVFLAIGVLTSIGILTDSIVGLSVHRGWSPHGIVVVGAWIQLWYWYPLLLLSTVYTLLLFPSGLPSRRWRPFIWVISAALAAMVVTAAIAPRLDVGHRQVPNPIGLSFVPEDVESTPIFAVAGIVIMAGLVLAVASLGIRFRRARNNERAQLKWFFLGAAFLGVFVVASFLSKSFNNSEANDAIAPIALTAMPLSCGLAIFRYRLYDIDRVVSRTVSYFVVTGSVVGIYVGAVALIESVLGFSSGIAVAASTLAAAAAFQPLRARVQRVIDRRFDRAAYDARRTVESFSNRLRDQVDVEAVRGDLLTTVSAAVAPAKASVWMATR
jgi:hypothetical protein